MTGLAGLIKQRRRWLNGARCSCGCAAACLCSLARGMQAGMLPPGEPCRRRKPTSAMPPHSPCSTGTFFAMIYTLSNWNRIWTESHHRWVARWWSVGRVPSPRVVSRRAAAAACQPPPAAACSLPHRATRHARPVCSPPLQLQLHSQVCAVLGVCLPHHHDLCRHMVRALAPVGRVCERGSRPLLGVARTGDAGVWLGCA